MLISQRFKDLLEDFHLVKHLFFPASVMKGEELHTYYWLHLVDSDFQSHVVFTKTLFANEPDLRLADYTEYLHYTATQDTLGLLRAARVTLNSDFDKTLDLFMISGFDQHLYISNKLYKTIIAHKITGLHIRAADCLTFE